VWTTIGATLRAGRERARTQDLLLDAADMTFYAMPAAVPTALVSIRAACLIAGPRRSCTAEAEVVHADRTTDAEPDRRAEIERVALWSARAAQVQALSMPPKRGLWEPQFTWRNDGRLELLIWRA
jgi:hypothetical protein